MKTTAILFSIILFSACMHAQPKKETRKLDGFTSIDLSIAAEVQITQGQNYSVEIEADPKDLKNIDSKVVDSKLKFDSNCNFCSFKDVKIYITLPKLTGIEIGGSGDITASNDFTTEALEIEISGSGSIQFQKLDAVKLDIDISGSGKITASGNTKPGDKLDIETSGSGTVYLENCPFNSVESDISGSGKVKVNALKNLKSDVSGSGSVYYKGNPIIDSEVSGSGKIESIQ